MNLNNLPNYAIGYINYKKLSNAPIIIGGCERSGTSLLQTILSAHPAIYVIPEETWAFCYSEAAGFKSSNPIKIIRILKYLGKIDKTKRYTRWCEKSPANVFYFDSILNYFSGDVKIIQIVRDGRDVITSMHPLNPSKPWVSIDRWINSVKNGLLHKSRKQVLTIRYEDLVLNFFETINKICDHIGESCNYQILNWHKHTLIKENRNIIGNKIMDLSSMSIRKFESPNFKHQSIIDDFNKNKTAVELLKKYNYT